MNGESKNDDDRDQATPSFVHTRGNLLHLGDEPYRVVGCNTYYLMAWAADPNLRPHVDQLLDTAADAGLNTVRTWAFNDGAREWNSLQPRPCVHDERVLEALDYVVWQAGERGLRLILPLVNHWEDYGGRRQYVVWSDSARRPDDFYRDPACATAAFAGGWTSWAPPSVPGPLEHSSGRSTTTVIPIMIASGSTKGTKRHSHSYEPRGALGSEWSWRSGGRKSAPTVTSMSWFVDLRPSITALRARLCRCRRPGTVLAAKLLGPTNELIVNGLIRGRRQ